MGALRKGAARARKAYRRRQERNRRVGDVAAAPTRAPDYPAVGGPRERDDREWKIVGTARGRGTANSTKLTAAATAFTPESGRSKRLGASPMALSTVSRARSTEPCEGYDEGKDVEGSDTPSDREDHERTSLSRGHSTIPLAPKGASEQLATSCPCAAAARDLPTTLESSSGGTKAELSGAVAPSAEEWAAAETPAEKAYESPTDAPSEEGETVFETPTEKTDESSTSAPSAEEGAASRTPAEKAYESPTEAPSAEGETVSDHEGQPSDGGPWGTEHGRRPTAAPTLGERAGARATQSASTSALHSSTTAAGRDAATLPPWQMNSGATPGRKRSAPRKAHEEPLGDVVEGKADGRRLPRLQPTARRSASKAPKAARSAPKPARPPEPKGSATPSVVAKPAYAQTVSRLAFRGSDAAPASAFDRPAAGGEITSPVAVEPEFVEDDAPSSIGMKRSAQRKAHEEPLGDDVEGKADERRPPRLRSTARRSASKTPEAARSAPKPARPPKPKGSATPGVAAKPAYAQTAPRPAPQAGDDAPASALGRPAAGGEITSPVAVEPEFAVDDSPSAVAEALEHAERRDAQIATDCPLTIRAQLDAEERITVPIGPRRSDRGAPPLDAVGRELRPYRAGVTSFPPWAGGVQPQLRVRMPRTHDAAARRNARRQEQHELQNGDRTAPKLDYELVDPREGIASSTSVEEIMRAAPGYGVDIDDLRARLALPIADCALSRAMHNNYLPDHLASGCSLCTAPVEPGVERLAGFHCDCWALRFYMNGTRGCRLEVGEVPPEPVVERNYKSLEEHPRSTAEGFMKHFRAGAFGPPRGAERRPPRTKHGPTFAERAYRGTMPRSVASSVLPSRCAPLGAAVRYADRLKAELLGVEPKARIIYDLTKVGLNAATFGGRRWRFRYAGLEALMPSLRKGGYCASFDLAAFYCQIPVDEQTSRYFVAEVPPLSPEERAEMGLEGPGPHFVRYRSLPMGWNASCAHASAFSAAICEEAMRRGANVAVSYIDDIAIAGDTYEECRRSQEIVRKVIEERFGLLINPTKTERPQKLLEWIGIAIDTEREQFCISATRSKRMVDEIRGLLKTPRPTVARVRSCLGRLSWLSMIMRGARAYSSPLFGAIKSKARMERVLLSPRDRLDLEWFVQQLEDKEWRGSLWLTPATQVSYAKSDAGDDAVFLVSEGRFLYHRLTAEERTLSSHARELLPAVLAARAFGPEWRGRYVAFAFDNSGTAFSVSSGASRDAGARDMLRMVADATVAYDFAMIGLWTQRAANVLNDAGSKVRVEKWSTEPVRIDYAADEMAASVLDVGKGCWLYPRFRDPTADLVLGYIQGDRHWC